MVLNLLKDNGLVVRADKCVFGVQEIDFLGYVIDRNGIKPKPTRVDAIQKFPQPRSKKGLQEFLGMVNYYHRFIPHAASLLQPLYRATANRENDLSWTPKMEAAFAQAENVLANATILSRPVYGAPLYLCTDASSHAVGGVLEQEVDNVCRPLAFFFRKKLSKAQTRYSTFD